VQSGRNLDSRVGSKCFLLFHAGDGGSRFSRNAGSYYRTIWRRIQEDIVLHQWRATTFVPEVRLSSSGIITTGLRVTWPVVGARFPKGTYLFCDYKAQESYGAYSTSYPMDTRGSFSRGKAAWELKANGGKTFLCLLLN